MVSLFKLLAEMYEIFYTLLIKFSLRTCFRMFCRHYIEKNLIILDIKVKHL